MRPTMSNSGFTLVELVISISIFSLIGLGCYRLLSQQALLGEKILHHSKELQQLQMAVNILERDIQQILAKARQPEEIQGKTADSSAHTPISGNQNSLRFTSLTQTLIKDKAQLQYESISYHLGNENRQEDWFQSTRKNNDQGLQREQFSNGNPAISQTLISGVAEIEFRYLDNQGEWHDKWPNESQNSSRSPKSKLKLDTPKAISLTLKSKHYQNVQMSFSMGGVQ